MSAIRVYVAAPKALASEVDAFHRWAHSHVAETRGRGASLDFTSTGWVQAVLDSKGVDPLSAFARCEAARTNEQALLSADVMLAWTAIGEPRETLVEIGRWLALRGGQRLIIAGSSSRNAFLSDGFAGRYIDATGTDSLRPYWPRMVEAIFNVMA